MNGFDDGESAAAGALAWRCAATLCMTWKRSALAALLIDSQTASRRTSDS